jgi:inhibitor of cysteine peptidase
MAVILLPPGKATVVTLASNPSTGYEWKLLSTNRRVVRLVSHRYVAPKVERPGAGGKEIWRFAARARGTVTLVFGYLRPWLPKQVVRRVRVTIRVT